ncbi:MAG: hypothetical protein KA419_03670 [Acidobacteria bacterium]|nr:hypothetical protein [Acidobacteriota bacterium]
MKDSLIRSATSGRAGGVLALAALLALALPGLRAGTPPDGTTAPANTNAIQGVRALYRAVEDGVAQGAFREARFELGGGQNPAGYVVHYLGGTEADFEKDPYAAPFHLRRLVLRKVLPAVGDAVARFYFAEDGSVAFVHTTGTDLCGGVAFDLAPPSEMRAYFRQGKLVRLVLGNIPSVETPEMTIDLPGCPTPDLRQKAEKTGQVLLRKAEELRQALAALAR